MDLAVIFKRPTLARASSRHRIRDTIPRESLLVVSKLTSTFTEDTKKAWNTADNEGREDNKTNYQ